jgi:UDP-N-acetylmuramoyl-tripeptide--D-alanyl-D-alanine ligase
MTGEGGVLLIGYLHRRKLPHGLNRAYAFAAAAKAEGAELLYFSPGAVDADGVDGYIYRNGEWAGTRCRYPDAVYNAAADSAPLRHAGIPFCSHSVGDKMTVYRNLQRYGRFAGYLVPSVTVRSRRHLISLLQQWPDMVVKPSSGRQGSGICRIRKGEAVPELPPEEYLAQPYINCRTKAGEPYDLRLHAQKGRGGQWTVPCVYPRISPDSGIVCNISRGGFTRDFDFFLKQEFHSDWYDMQKYLDVFALQLAEHMDEIQRELYGEELDELGIDVGVGSGRRLYIYEVNWRPGYPPYGSVNLTVARNSIQYAMYLAGRGGRPRPAGKESQ